RTFLPDLRQLGREPGPNVFFIDRDRERIRDIGDDVADRARARERGGEKIEDDERKRKYAIQNIERNTRRKQETMILVCVRVNAFRVIFNGFPHSVHGSASKLRPNGDFDRGLPNLFFIENCFPAFPQPDYATSPFILRPCHFPTGYFPDLFCAGVRSGGRYDRRPNVDARFDRPCRSISFSRHALVSNSTNTEQGCGQWDYNCETYLWDSTRTDSLKNVATSATVSNYPANTNFPY